MVRYKIRKKGFEQLASISLSLGSIHHILKSQISYDTVLLDSIVFHRKVFPSWANLSNILGPRFVRTKFSPKKDSETSPFRLFHSPAFAPPAELKQVSKMLGWEIPPPLEENPTHTYAKYTQFRIITNLAADCIESRDSEFYQLPPLTGIAFTSFFLVNY